MSGEGGSTAEKDQAPTPKRLRDAREKGQVAKSNDINSTALLIAMFVYMGIAWTFFLAYFGQLVLLPVQYFRAPFLDTLNELMDGMIYAFMIITFPIALTVAVVGTFSNFFQTGPIFSFEPIKPDLKKLNPISALKKIFSIKSVVEFLKSVFKITFLSTLVFFAVRNLIDSILKMPYGGVRGILEALPHIMLIISINIGLAYIVLAAFDFFFQKQQHTKELRMTKDEVKREHKEMEGDPLIKSKRKQLHREMATNSTMERTKKSSVLVTNPTHYAIALEYTKGKTKLPVVVAKGEGYNALQMMEIARQENIPIMRNVPLAHALYEVEVDQYIPGNLIEPVAEVLRWVQDLKESGG